MNLCGAYHATKLRVAICTDWQKRHGINYWSWTGGNVYTQISAKDAGKKVGKIIDNRRNCQKRKGKKAASGGGYSNY
jgi:hypothetical protein